MKMRALILGIATLLVLASVCVYSSCTRRWEADKFHGAWRNDDLKIDIAPDSRWFELSRTQLDSPIGGAFSIDDGQITFHGAWEGKTGRLKSADVLEIDGIDFERVVK